MSDYSSHIERDAFDGSLCDLIEEYIQCKDAYSVDTVLAIQNQTLEIELGIPADFDDEWRIYPIQTLIRNNEDNTGKEVDIDATHEIASSFLFVR